MIPKSRALISSVHGRQWQGVRGFKAFAFTTFGIPMPASVLVAV
jgi:hypothetical protein